MWIFAGGMPRAASTLQYQIAGELIERYDLGIRITWFPPAEHHKVFKKYCYFYRYKVFKPHEATSSIVNQFHGNCNRT